MELEPVEEKELEKAKAIAYRLLSVRYRSVDEVIRKLQSKGIRQPIIEITINLLKEYNYLDDQKFAEAWIDNRNRLKPMGKRRLKLELMEKGIAPSIISETLAQFGGEDEETLANALASKKVGRNPNFSPRKLEQYLLRRGFSPMLVRKIVTKICSNLAEFTEDDA